MVGGDKYRDACVGAGVVRGLLAKGDGFLSVRKGPSTRFRRIDKIHNGQRLIICGNRGNWYSVVYTKKGTNCRVGHPIAKRQRYRGRCWNGWVHRNWVKFLAD